MSDGRYDYSRSTVSCADQLSRSRYHVLRQHLGRRKGPVWLLLYFGQRFKNGAKNRIHEQKDYFCSDKYLAAYVSSIMDHDFITWDGYCPVHANIDAAAILKLKTSHPQAKVIAHPECKPEITRLADVVSSTEGMSKHIKNSSDKEFIIATEIGILHRLKNENPEKTFYSASEKAICADMKKITLEKVLWSLENRSYEITLPADILQKARHSIEKMLQTV